jgi:hypothetical protein
MLEKEVIVLNQIPDQEYDRLLTACVKYALISFPFTVNRMGIASEKQRILNIAKGKIAEALFWFFCKHNDIRPDHKSCATDFWEVDKRDFLLAGYEWDIKNNFIYHNGDQFNGYIYLPSLIPNRFNGDQWSKRLELMSKQVKGTRYLFTFLKNAGLTKFKERQKEFLELCLSPAQEQFLHSLYNQYKGKPQRQEPFKQEWFWQQMELKGLDEYYKLHFRPSLIITCYADSSTFSLFKDTGPTAPFNYQEYVNPVWYTKSSSKGSINFLNSTFWSTINNATCPVAELPSFSSLFPHLLSEIRYGYLKNTC